MDYRLASWVIDYREISRIISYWREGAYHVNPLGYDGYAAGTGSTNGSPSSADYRDGDWTIDGLELTRALTYWRAGGYHIDPEGDDGYASGGDGAGGAPAAAETKDGSSALSSAAPDFIEIQTSQQSPAYYDPGGTVTRSCSLIYSDVLLGLCWQPQIPAGWTIVSVSGDGNPEVRRGEIVWLGTLPESPIDVTYTVSVPLWELGTRQISDYAWYYRPNIANAASVSGATTTLVMMPRDTDGDGLPDGWEQHYGGTPDGMSPGDDDDADGMNNLGESVAGTDPTDPESVLRINGTQVGANEFFLHWPSVANRIYSIGRSTNLVEGFSPWAGDLEATPPVNVYSDFIDTEPKGFYRINVNIETSE